MTQIDKAMAATEEQLKLESDRAISDYKCAIELVTLLGHLIAEGGFGGVDYMGRFGRFAALIPQGIYRLHKSTPEVPKDYVVLGVGDHSEDKSQFLVACSAMYPPHQGGLVFRPVVGKGGFLTPVSKGTLFGSGEEYSVPRFKFIKQLPQSFSQFLELAQ